MTNRRFASPNEQRAISREHCGFYNALAIGAVYEFYALEIDITSTRSFYGALRRCIDKYPTLSVVVRDSHTDTAYFERVATINLENHVHVVEESRPDALHLKTNDLTSIEMLLPSIIDRPWPVSSGAPPPWKIIVLPLPSSKGQGQERARCFIAFSFSHALGDGIIGLAFHRTFRDGIFDPFDQGSPTVATPIADFPAPFDTPARYPVSWGFLLGPLLGVLLPEFVAKLCGLRATTSAANSGTWTGTKTFFEPESRSCNKLMEIDGPEVERLLRVARDHEAKITGIIHQCIIRALSRAIPQTAVMNFVSATAVNMRRAVGTSNDEMGFFVNAHLELHDRRDAWASPWTEYEWTNARSLTKELADCAVTLEDQPVGLLRYIPSISRWTAGKIGKERDSSYELSNLGACEFGQGEKGDGKRCNVSKMVFCRPASPVSAPFTVSIVSVRGGSMVTAVGWQSGALGVPLESEEAFVDELCAFVENDLRGLK